MAERPHTPELHEQPDEWHLHTAEEGVPQEEHGSTINTTLLMLAFVGTVASIALVVVLTWVYFTSHIDQLRRSRIETTALAADYLDYRNRSDDALHDYAWVDEERTVVSLPLGVAMERVLERYNGEQNTEEPQR